VCCSMLQCVAVCCSVLQCSIYQYVEICVNQARGTIIINTHEPFSNTHVLLSFMVLHLVCCSACCSMLQHVAACCSIRCSIRCRMLQHVATCFAACYSVLQIKTVYGCELACAVGVLQCVALCCSVLLQSVAVYCSVLQCIVMRWHVLSMC